MSVELCGGVKLIATDAYRLCYC